jgi:hypothetical protein
VAYPTCLLSGAAVDPPQWITSAVESRKFYNGAFSSSEWSLAGLGWLQELVNGIEEPQHISEHDLHLLIPYPDADAEIHGRKQNLNPMIPNHHQYEE